MPTNNQNNLIEEQRHILNSKQQTTIFSLLSNGLNLIYKNLFNENWWIIGGASITSLMCITYGAPFIFSVFLEKALIAGFTYSSLEGPFEKFVDSFTHMFSDTKEYVEKEQCSHTQRILTLLITLALLHPVSSVSSIFSFNLTDNLLINSLSLTLSLSCVYKLLDIISDGFFEGFNLVKIYNTFQGQESIGKLLVSVSLGLLVLGYINLSFINPFISATALDGVIKLVLATVVGYFPGSVLYESASNLMLSLKNNLLHTYSKNENNEIVFNKETVIGEFCIESKNLFCTCYDAYQNSFGKVTQDKNDNNNVPDSREPGYNFAPSA